MPNFIDVMDRLDEMDKKLDMIKNILHGMMSEDKHND